MESKRHVDGDFVPQSPVAGNFRDNRRPKWSPDPYSVIQRREPGEGPRRSLSPPRRRVFVGGDRRSISLERRDYGWHLGGGGVDRPRSRSPPPGQIRKRARPDDVLLMNRSSPSIELQRKYQLMEAVEFPNDANPNLKRVYGYDEHTNYSNTSKDKDFTDGHPRLVKKSAVLEESGGHGNRAFLRVPTDMGPTPKYVEADRDFSSSPRNSDMGMGLVKDERIAYRNPDKLVLIEKYKDYMRDPSYTMVPTSQFKDFGSTSSGISRAEFRVSYQERLPLVSKEYISGTGKMSEAIHPKEYPSGYGRTEEVQRIYRRDPRSPDREEFQEYIYPRYEIKEGDSYRKIPAGVRVEYDYRNPLRTRIMERVVDHIDEIDDSHGIIRKNDIWDYPPVQKQRVPNHIDDIRISNVSHQAREYMDSRVDSGRRVPRDHEIVHSRPDYGFGRDAGPGSYKARLKSPPPGFKYGSEMRRLDSDEREIMMLKRKYIIDEEISRHDSRRIMISKRNLSGGTRILNENEEWFDEDMGKQYRRVDKTYDDRDRRRVQVYEDSLEYVRERSPEFYESGSRSFRGGRRPGQPGHPGWYRNSYLDRRREFHKPNNVWRRDRDDYEAGDDVDPSEEWISHHHANTEPPEDSEEFKQLVHKAFLIFSKKVNDNPGVRRRYTEQGREGSLFCIVCSRSISKEFMDTQRLATHAFMSHKTGKRGLHLGLHKAICVLMGWNHELLPDTYQWLPQPMPADEALAQKQDLILWPPIVIIHNISILNNNADQHKVISAEALGSFLRGVLILYDRFLLCLAWTLFRYDVHVLELQMSRAIHERLEPALILAELDLSEWSSSRDFRLFDK